MKIALGTIITDYGQSIAIYFYIVTVHVVEISSLGVTNMKSRKMIHTHTNTGRQHCHHEMKLKKKRKKRFIRK